MTRTPLYDTPEGHEKLMQMRRALLLLKHEVKDALKSGVKYLRTERVNERLQHIAKIPRPGLSKVRCNGNCMCKRGIAS